VSEPETAPAEEPVREADDATLGGYLRTHDRPPAFQGSDGHPYTVSIEVEKTPDLRRPFAGFLVFPRWALTGVGIVGHLETPTLWTGSAREDVFLEIGTTSLIRVATLLEESIRRARRHQDS
jgi:hypothetical protein